MIDRLEELLAALADEDEKEDGEEEERENVPALADPAVPGMASPERDNGKAIPAAPRGNERRDALGPVAAGEANLFIAAAAEREAASPVEKRRDALGPVAAGKADLFAAAAAEREAASPVEKRRDALGPVAAGEADLLAAVAAEREAAFPMEKRQDGLEWTAQIGALPSAEAVWRQRTGQTGETAAEFARTVVEVAAEAARERLSPEQSEALARAIRHEAGSGLEGLYRQAVQASRPAAPQAVGVEQGGQMLYAVEPERTAGLTVDELDRAVRRDSRRYDGGMTIF